MSLLLKPYSGRHPHCFLLLLLLLLLTPWSCGGWVWNPYTYWYPPLLFFVFFFFFFYSFYQTAAYAMGKHVPSGNLFPTVRTRRLTGQCVHLLTERVRLPTDRSNDRPTTVRSLSDACTVLLRLDNPF